MRTKYDELTLTHNLSGVILPSDSYEQIYSKGAYLIPPGISLYNDTDLPTALTRLNEDEVR